jgi:hypothetical protein
MPEKNPFLIRLNSTPRPIVQPREFFWVSPINIRPRPFVILPIYHNLEIDSSEDSR